jgi:hypothetical protein
MAHTVIGTLSDDGLKLRNITLDTRRFHTRSNLITGDMTIYCNGTPKTRKVNIRQNSDEGYEIIYLNGGLDTSRSGNVLTC